MTTGARRAELCTLRWSDIRMEDEQDLLIARAYITRNGQQLVTDTKTHQKRRLALDTATTEVLTEQRQRCRRLAEQAGVDFDGDGYMFSRDGFGEHPWLPDTVTHQFARLAKRVGVSCRLHDLRHFSRPDGG